MQPTPVFLPGIISWREKPGELLSRVTELDTTERLHFHFFTFMLWRRKWQPTPVFLPGESQGWGSLVGSVCGVAQSRTQLKRLSSSSSRYIVTS